MNMARKVAPGVYKIGIYDVHREGRRWTAYASAWGRVQLIGYYCSLEAAHIALTGESRHG